VEKHGFQSGAYIEREMLWQGQLAVSKPCTASSRVDASIRQKELRRQIAQLEWRQLEAERIAEQEAANQNSEQSIEMQYLPKGRAAR